MTSGGEPGSRSDAEGIAKRLVVPPEPRSGRGRKHGTSSSEPYDRWFRYPAGFASDYVALLLSHIDVPPGGVIVDPFAGSGVTGTAARRAGYGFYGIETHPMVAELAALKMRPPSEPTANLVRFSERIAEQGHKMVRNRRPRLDGESTLVTRSFEPGVLKQLVALREAIKANSSTSWASYTKWALLGTLRDVAAVSVGWPYQRPGKSRQARFADPIRRFGQRISMIAADLDSVGTCEPSSASVICGDARAGASWEALPAGLGSACLSSPPYLNNFDYADATRLELYFWGEVQSWKGMCDVVRAGMVTATTQQTSMSAAETAIKAIRNYGETGKEIVKLAEDLQDQRMARKRGKEYDRVIAAYFVGIVDVLRNLAAALPMGAQSLWLIGDSAPYGVYVDTPRIIGQLAELVGFRVQGDVILRKRGQRWTGNTSRHRVELSERLVVFDRS